MNRRLGPHHFAYLRALAEGIDSDTAARLYLGLEHGHQLRTLHRDLVEQLRALARRAGDRRWRVIGLRLQAGPAASTALPSPPQARTLPDLDTWAEQQGLDGWTQAELLELYQQALGQAPPSFKADPKADPEAVTHAAAARTSQRRLERASRLRKHQLAALAELERSLVTPAAGHDPLDAWFEPAPSARLLRAGFVTLDDLRRAIALGGRWYKGMPGIGPVKAERIASLLAQLLPAAAPSAVAPHVAGGFRLSAVQRLALDGSAGSNRSPHPARIQAGNDLEAIDAWIEARAGSPATEKVYRREAERWLLWCVLERGKAMSGAGPEDCVAYMDFLNRVPEAWMSRRKAARHDLGWTPFRGQPGLAARRLAVTVLRLMCQWLAHQARFLDSNPWAAVNLRRVDGDELPPERSSRSLSHEAYAALLAALPEPRRPGQSRNGFVLVFCRHTGLRASELLGASVGALACTDDGWLLRVVGKGRKPRQVSVATPAMAVLRDYLQARGLPTVEVCPPTAPLLASDGDPIRRPTYSAVHQSFRSFVLRAVRTSALPMAERDRLAKATQHWLRHTFATRWAEADGPMDVLQAELGHASPTTTAGYYTAQQRRRQREVERISMLAMGAEGAVSRA